MVPSKFNFLSNLKCNQGGEGDSLNNGRYGCAGPEALGISGVNFCPDNRSWEVNFARASGFGQFLTKKNV